MGESFDVAVIGRGMIGASAARHIAEAGHRTALIGPTEPEDYRSSGGPFASFWDQGRITRLAARSRTWAMLARRSIDRYADIAARSGIEFHTPRAVAVAFPNAAEWVEHARACGGDARLTDADDFEQRTGVHLPNGGPVAVEGPPAGFINPRLLVAAQAKLAELAGATLVDHAAAALARPKGERGPIRISGPWGSLDARRVLLATGAFGPELLGVTLELWRRPRTVVLAEFDDEQRLPSLILDNPSDPRLGEIYWVPPVRYPDGRVCLKIGGEMHPVPASDPASLVRWFHDGGSPDEIDALTATVRELLPRVEVRSWGSQPCVVTQTPSAHPYIGWVDDNVAVAIGGNGSAAKSCDELGRLAGLLTANGEWPDTELAAETFAPAFI